MNESSPGVLTCGAHGIRTLPYPLDQIVIRPRLPVMKKARYIGWWVDGDWCLTRRGAWRLYIRTAQFYATAGIMQDMEVVHD